MRDKVHVVGHCSFAGGGGASLYFLSSSGFDSRDNDKSDNGKTAKSFIDCNIERAEQITIEITLNDGSKTKAVIDL